MTKSKPRQQEIESKPEESLEYNMKILEGMIERCSHLYAQKTADISRGLERDFIDRRISYTLYQHYNTMIERSVSKFGEKCACHQR